MGSHGGMQAQIHEPRGSLYSLTLDEVQNQLRDLGKPLTSMNIDELLKTLCSVESNHGIGGLDVQNFHGSSDLSKKTVDEVLRDIQNGQKSSNLDRQKTLGEITLEDFLVKAGIVSESVKNLDSILRVPPQQAQAQVQAQWNSYQLPEQLQQQSMVPVYMPIGTNQIMEGVYPESQMTISPSPGRKRVASGDGVERSVERRQKRMIKNRESAARSRARKQAYTNELENKITRLEEENERLKRQQEIEKILPTVPAPEPKYQLRRTSSAPI